jgi:DNA-binding transcriptional LysR family regulator
MVVERMPRLRVVPFRPPGLTRTVALAHRKDVDLPRAAREFVREARDLLDEWRLPGRFGHDTEILQRVSSLKGG